MFCARLFICALWSPAGKGLTSWLSFVVSTVSVSLSHWYPGSGVVLDCIDSWSLHTYLLCPSSKNLCINKCDMAVHQTLGLISVFAHCTPILLVLSCGFSSESLLFSKITFFSHTTKTRYSDVDTVHVRHMQRARVGGGGLDPLENRKFYSLHMDGKYWTPLLPHRNVGTLKISLK